MGSPVGGDSKALSVWSYNNKLEQEMSEKTASHEIHPSQLRDVEGIIFSYSDEEDEN